MASSSPDIFAPRHEPARSIYLAFQAEAGKVMNAAGYALHEPLFHKLRYAISLARKVSDLDLQSAPQSPQEVRALVTDLAGDSGVNWITGQVALVLLDAAIDGRNLLNDPRLGACT